MSGLKNCVMGLEIPSCARSDRETVCLKGQGRRGSNSSSLHEGYEEGDMSPVPRPIPVEVDTQAQLVTVPRGEERGTVEGDCLPQGGILCPPSSS